MTSTSLPLSSPLDLADGASALQQYLLLHKLYAAQLGDGKEPLASEERRTLLELAQRILDLVEPADLFVQLCQEQITQAKGPDLDTQIARQLMSEPLGAAAKAVLSDRNPVNLAEDGARSLRTILAADLQRLPQALDQLRAGQRPVASHVSSDAGFGAGATVLVGGVAVIAAVALAPKAAAVVVEGTAVAVGTVLAVGGAALIGGGLGMMVGAVAFP